MSIGTEARVFRIKMKVCMRISVGLLSAFYLLLLYTADSLGENLTFEDLAFMEIEDVFATAKHLQKIREVPASVTVISSDDIMKYGYRNLIDVLKNIRSFYTYSDRNYDYKDMGHQSASLAKKILANEKLPQNIIEPRQVRIAINEKVTKSMGVSFTHEFLRTVNQFF